MLVFPALETHGRITKSLRPTYIYFYKLSQKEVESQNINVRQTLNKVKDTEQKLLLGDKGYCEAKMTNYPVGARSHKLTELN